MKKLICLYIILCMVCTVSFAAPYDMEYLTSSKFKLAMMIDSLRDLGFSGADTDKGTADSDADTPSTDKKPVTFRHISDVAAAVAVVESIAYATYDGDNMHKMTYYVSGSENAKECYFNTDSDSYGGAFLYDDLTPGSLVYVELDKNRVVDEYCILAVLDRTSGIPQVDLSASGMFNSDKIQYTYSYILDYGSSNGEIGIDLTDGNSLSIPADSIKYTVEPKRGSVKIHQDDCLAADVYSAEYDENLGKSIVYPVISVAYKGEAVFTCAYSVPMYLNGDITQ